MLQIYCTQIIIIKKKIKKKKRIGKKKKGKDQTVTPIAIWRDITFQTEIDWQLAKISISSATWSDTRTILEVQEERENTELEQWWHLLSVFQTDWKCSGTVLFL